MIVTCEACMKIYDDVDHWTLCPHRPLELSSQWTDCEAHGNSNPCIICVEQKGRGYLRIARRTPVAKSSFLRGIVDKLRLWFSDRR